MYKSVLFCVLVAASLLSPDSGFAKSKSKKREYETKTSPIQKFDYGFGLSLGAGTYSGITAIVPWSRNTYFQANLGVVFLNSSLALSTDYIFEFTNLFALENVVPYAGGGVTVLMGEDYASLVSDTDGDVHLGARIPLGVYLLLDGLPVQLYGEVVPGFLVMAKFNAILSISLGARWLL